MKLQPQLLRTLCVATQTFVNLPRIMSTADVRVLFEGALWAGSPKKSPVALQWSSKLTIADFERDQHDIRKLLNRIATLYELRATPRLWEAAAAPMRESLAATLLRLPMLIVNGYNPRTGALLQYPMSFGVEAALYYVAWAMLEPRATAYVRICELAGCDNLVLHAGGRSHPTYFCDKSHADSSNPRRSNQRRRRR